MDFIADDDLEHAADAFLAQASRNVDKKFKPVYVMPGDDVTTLCTGLQSNITLGKGHISFIE